MGFCDFVYKGLVQTNRELGLTSAGCFCDFVYKGLVQTITIASNPLEISFCDFVYKGLVQTSRLPEQVFIATFLRLRLQRLGSNDSILFFEGCFDVSATSFTKAWFKPFSFKSCSIASCFCDFVYKGLVQTRK